VPIAVSPNPHNIHYLQTKRDKLGHLTILRKPKEGGDSKEETGNAGGG
jgi:hypothetical protein